MKKNLQNIVAFILILMLMSVSLSAQHNTSPLGSAVKTDPDIEILTPAFSKELGFTNYNELITFLETETENRKDLVKIEWIGESGLGKKIPALILDNGSEDVKIKIWMQGGLHGNEPASSEGLLMFIHYLINESEADTLFNHLTLMIVPMANIDGYEIQSRYSASGADLNRDQTRLLEPETVFLKRAFADFSPHIAIDFHEYQPTRTSLKDFSENKLSIPYDVLFLPSGNLNIPQNLHKITHDLFLENAKTGLEFEGLSSHYYFLPETRKDNTRYLKMGGSSPRSSSSSFGLSNAISILFEVRGIGLGKELFKRRVFSTYLLAKSVTETAYLNNSRVINEVNKAIELTMSMNEGIVMEASPAVYKDEVQFLDLDKHKIINMELEIEDDNESSVVLSRNRPSGYILFPECEEIVNRLKILGLEIDTLKVAQKVKLESYTILSSGVKDPDDKFAVNIVTTELEKIKKLCPAGSFFVSARQKNANLAISTLEPEMANGFVRYGILPANSGDELPIYRVLKNSKIKQLYY
ncbi:MAG: M14 family metallocarboxypeptidase [Bacteroidales bacterium]|nr:M14 family metallocarboxypeptidase [Bacteroidales bacterium]MCF8390926.1 M14 family metallocarboxypeptidase [Bacteroidales bacterium]